MRNNNIKYHLSCPSCLRLWWSENPFPELCPYCKKQIPVRGIKYNDLLKNIKKEVKYNDK